MTLVKSRLTITVIMAAKQRKKFPNNTYLSISEKDAWSLLYKTLTHTRSINRYSFEMLVCGLSIASNTEIVNSMEKTLNSSEKIISHTQSLKKIAKTL